MVDADRLMSAPHPWLPMPLIPLGCDLLAVVYGTMDENGETRGVVQFHALADEVRGIEPRPEPLDALAMMEGEARPRVDMLFENVEAIDSFISQLQALRKQMTG